MPSKPPISRSELRLEARVRLIKEGRREDVLWARSGTDRNVALLAHGDSGRVVSPARDESLPRVLWDRLGDAFRAVYPTKDIAKSVMPPAYHVA